MEFKKQKMQLEESEEDRRLILKNVELDCIINLEDSETSDLKKFFDKIFEYIIAKEELLEFELDVSTDKVLFKNVAEDLIKQINAEIRNSEQTFSEILQIKKSIQN